MFIKILCVTEAKYNANEEYSVSILSIVYQKFLLHLNLNLRKWGIRGKKKWKKKQKSLSSNRFTFGYKYCLTLFVYMRFFREGSSTGKHVLLEMLFCFGEVLVINTKFTCVISKEKCL